MAIKMISSLKNESAAKRLAGINLTDSQATQGEEILSRLRRGDGAIILDKDGVISHTAEQIAEALKRAFKEHYDPERGIEYDFDSKSIYKMFGLDKRYNDGPTPILAIMSLNLEAREMSARLRRSGGRVISADALLREILESDNAAGALDALIAKHASQGKLPSSQFVAENMYWWRDPDGFFRSAEASNFIYPYTGPENVTSWDAAIALHDAGLKVAFLTNGPFIRSDWIKAGCTEEDMAARVSVGTYVDGTVFLVTRDQLSETRMKPDPFGLFYIAKEMGISLENSYFVGDTKSDIKCAQNTRAVAPIAVLSGMGREADLKEGAPDLIVYPDFPTLAAAILRPMQNIASPIDKALLRPS